METENTNGSQAPSDGVPPPPEETVTETPPLRSRKERLKAVDRKFYIPPHNPPPPANIIEDIPAEDLELEFSVRIRSRTEVVFSQQRKVSIWKGAVPSGTHRYLATTEISTQLKHLCRTVDVEMNGYSAQADKKPAATTRVPADDFDHHDAQEAREAQTVTAEFVDTLPTAKIPPEEQQ